MAELYDKKENRIYAGRGPYSRSCRKLIVEGRAYFKDDDGKLQEFVEETHEQMNPSSSTKKAIKRLQKEAELASDILGMNVSGYEVSVDVDDRTYVASLARNLSKCISTGLTHQQAAKLFQSVVGWMSSIGMTVGQAEQLVESLHETLGGMMAQSSRQQNPLDTVVRSSSRGSRRVSRSNNLLEVNCIPGTRTSACWDELWIEAFRPAINHPHRPSISEPEAVESANVPTDPQHGHHGRETWEKPVAIAWKEHVCDNLHDAVRSSCFIRGAHNVIRIFLPETERIDLGEEEQHWDIHCNGEMEHRHKDCLERFIDECRGHKAGGTSPDLRVFIHRGLETEEVSL